MALIKRLAKEDNPYREFVTALKEASREYSRAKKLLRKNNDSEGVPALERALSIIPTNEQADAARSAARIRYSLMRRDLKLDELRRRSRRFNADFQEIRYKRIPGLSSTKPQKEA